MPITVGSGTGFSTLNFTSNDAAAFVQYIASIITANEVSGAFTSVNYTAANGSLAPSPPNGGGVVTFSQPTAFTPSGAPISVLIPTTDQGAVYSGSGPLSVQGGAPGELFIAGAPLTGSTPNVTYTQITPSGTATDLIGILGGNNLVQTSVSGGGNYIVETGNGNDTINILTGNGTINPGTGSNQVNVGTGTNQIYSEGFDTITGSSVTGGADTVSIGSGQTSVNSGLSTFTINDISPNPLTVTLGTGIDTINSNGAGAESIHGAFSSASVTGAGGLVAYDRPGGDTYSIIGGFGALNATVTAGAGNESITGASDKGSLLFNAGTGNDTLIAGAGSSTLTGAVGVSASALLVGGAGPTTFSFVNGQSAGSDTITGFNANDFLSFKGYGGNPTGTALALGSNTIITLNDGTTIQLNGLSAAPSGGQLKIS